MGAVCPRRGRAEEDDSSFLTEANQWPDDDRDEDHDDDDEHRPSESGPSAKRARRAALAATAAAEAKARGKKFYMCECHASHNFFVRCVGKHLEYSGDDAAFLERYSAELADALKPPPPVPGGGGAAHDIVTMRDVLADVKKQREERLVAPAEASARADRIAQEYKPLRPEVYALDKASFLSDSFREVVAALKEGPSADVGKRMADLKAKGLLNEVRPGLFTLEVLTDSFCAKFEEELANFAASGLPSTAPNTMNRHGVILSELGFGPKLLEPLVRDHISPLGEALLPELSQGGLDSFRAFTVLYDAAEGGDRDLALHYDNAEVTLNINVGGDWEGGSISYHGLATLTESEAGEPVDVTLKRGWGVLHAGLDLHRATPITSGRRHNLVIWCRASAVRNVQCPMCFEPPRCMPTSRFGDEGFKVPPCRLSDASWDSGLRELFS